MTGVTNTASVQEFRVFEHAGLGSLGVDATISASSVWDGTGRFAAHKASDFNQNTRWNATPNQTAGQWLQLDWQRPREFKRVYGTYS